MNHEVLWEEVAAYHGCKCPALAIGFRAVTFVMERFGFSETGPFPIVCIAECFSCGIDAVQAIFKCTVGNGRLRIQNQHRMAFRFCHTELHKSILLVLRPSALAGNIFAEDILAMPVHQLFNVTTLAEIPADSPNCFLSSACEVRRPGEEMQKRVFQVPVHENLLYRSGYDRDW